MRVAHLSDPHIRTGPLAGEPAAGLHRALQWILALDPQPDCVVITGDLCEYGHPGAYPDLLGLIEHFPLPVHLTTGNHDDPEALLATFGGTRFLGDALRYTVEYPDATIVALDSRRPDSPAGLLGAEQLGWLDGVLGARPEVPAFVCLHHPPVPVGIPFLDGMILDDAAGLAAVIGKHPHVVRVLAGHVHRDTSALFAGTVVTTAPSTWRQAALRLHDAEPPGYVADPTGFLLHLLDGTRCVTHSVAVSHAAAVRAF